MERRGEVDPQHLVGPGLQGLGHGHIGVGRGGECLHVVERGICHGLGPEPVVAVEMGADKLAVLVERLGGLVVEGHAELLEAFEAHHLGHLVAAVVGVGGGRGRDDGIDVAILGGHHVAELQDLVLALCPLDGKGLDSHPADHDLVQRRGGDARAEDRVLAERLLGLGVGFVGRLVAAAVDQEEQLLVVLGAFEHPLDVPGGEARGLVERAQVAYGRVGDALDPRLAVLGVLVGLAGDVGRVGGHHGASLHDAQSVVAEPSLGLALGDHALVHRQRRLVGHFLAQHRLDTLPWGHRLSSPDG